MKKYWTQEIPRRRNFELMKYLREKISNPLNKYEKKFWTHEISKGDYFGPMSKNIGPDDV